MIQDRKIERIMESLGRKRVTTSFTRELTVVKGFVRGVRVGGCVRAEEVVG